VRQLAPNLFDRRFQDFMEMGRARLPGLAPVWTDHNAHDPGITLMELLAWVAEAQLYSVSHLRRDERAAYAAVLGLAPRGTEPARGLIWPDPRDPRSPLSLYTQTAVIPLDATVTMLDAEAPVFRPAQKLLWVPGRIARLEARLADGRVLDHTAPNRLGGVAFLPFGELAGRRDVLTMEFECRGEGGLFPRRRADAEGAWWAIGVRADAPLVGADPQAADLPKHRSPLAAAVIVGGARYPIAIVLDSTAGLLRTGVLLLDLSGVPGSPTAFTLELRGRDGFERPPRLLRIEPNVVPIVQGRTVSREAHRSTGVADWSFSLEAPGLSFEAGEEPVEVEVDEAANLNRWTRCPRLGDQGPEDRVYEFDADRGRVTFGNGINGRAPAEGDTVYVTYAVSDGQAGIVARNRQWRVAGFAGAFGVNPDAIAGGATPAGWIDQRREARRRARQDHALVSADDIESAARALPLLEVARAWVVPPLPNMPRTGVVTLVAVRARPYGKEPDTIPETRRWLEAIRRRLAPRMPLGARLVVSAPAYVEVFVRASLETEPGADPAVVKEAVEAELSRRLALVSTDGEVAPRAPGVPVSRRDVATWTRAVVGVRRVIRVELFRAGRREAHEEVWVPRGGLPRFSLPSSTIDVQRPAAGGRP